MPRAIAMQPEEIGRIIATAILERRLVPGRRLNELELSRLLGVSRSMIRFALVARMARLTDELDALTSDAPAAGK